MKTSFVFTQYIHFTKFPVVEILWKGESGESPKLCRNYVFWQNFRNRNLGEIWVFCTVINPKNFKNVWKTLIKIDGTGNSLKNVFDNKNQWAFFGPCFPVFSPNTGKNGPEKSLIWTLFTQWLTIQMYAEMSWRPCQTSFTPYIPLLLIYTAWFSGLSISGL